MDNKLEVFNNNELGLKIRTILNDDGSIQVSAEDTAAGFGWIRTQNINGKEYTSIRWERMNGFIDELDFHPQVGEGDFIPESLFYMLGMKANNKVAQEFQKWLAIEVIPSIRKTGSYKVKNDKSYKDKTLDLVSKAIDELPNDETKNKIILKILENLNNEPKNNVLDVTQSDEYIKIKNLLLDFLKAEDVILKQTMNGLAIKKEPFYELFANYGYTKILALKTLDDLGFIYHPKAGIRTIAVKLHGNKVIRTVVLKNLDN